MRPYCHKDVKGAALPLIMAIDTPDGFPQDTFGDDARPTLIQFLEKIGQTKARPIELNNIEFFVPAHVSGIPDPKPPPKKVGKSKKSSRPTAQKKRDAKRAAKKSKDKGRMRTYAHGGPRIAHGIGFVTNDQRAPDYWEFMGQRIDRYRNIRRMFRMGWVYGDFMVLFEVTHDSIISDPKSESNVANTSADANKSTSTDASASANTSETTDNHEDGACTEERAQLRVFAEIITAKSTPRHMKHIRGLPLKGNSPDEDFIDEVISVHAPDGALFDYEVWPAKGNGLCIRPLQSRVENDWFAPNPEKFAMSKLPDTSRETVKEFARAIALSSHTVEPHHIKAVDSKPQEPDSDALAQLVYPMTGEELDNCGLPPLEESDEVDYDKMPHLVESDEEEEAKSPDTSVKRKAHKGFTKPKVLVTPEIEFEGQGNWLHGNPDTAADDTTPLISHDSKTLDEPVTQTPKTVSEAPSETTPLLDADAETDAAAATEIMDTHEKDEMEVAMAKQMIDAVEKGFTEQIISPEKMTPEDTQFSAKLGILTMAMLNYELTREMWYHEMLQNGDIVMQGDSAAPTKAEAEVEVEADVETDTKAEGTDEPVPMRHEPIRLGKSCDVKAMIKITKEVMEAHERDGDHEPEQSKEQADASGSDDN